MAHDHEKLHYIGIPNDKALKAERSKKLSAIVDQHVLDAKPGDQLVSFYIGLSVPVNLAVQYSSWSDLQLAISTSLRHRATKGYLDGSRGVYIKRKTRRLYEKSANLTKKEATAALYAHVDHCLKKGLIEVDDIEERTVKKLSDAYGSRHALRMGIHEVRRRILVNDTGKHSRQ